MSVNKITAERNQKILLDLVSLPGNDVCADCKVKNPRWAAHNLGIFICVSCASVHRKIGTHVSKVKSLTMDAWTREQTENMKNNGNIKSNQFHNPNEARHPPPPNLMDGERDSEMEQFIRSKYEYKSFVDRSALVASKLGPSRSAASMSPNPPPSSTSNATPSSSKPPVRANTTIPETKAPPPRTLSQPAALQSQPQAVPQIQQQRPPQQQPPAPAGVWNDLISLQTPSSSSTLPLQIQATPAPMPGYAQQQRMGMNSMNTGYQPQMPPFMGMGGMPANGYQSQFATSQLLPSTTGYMAPMQQQMPFGSSLSSGVPPFASQSMMNGGPPAAPLYNPQPQAFAPQQPLFQGAPMSQGSPGPQGYGYQQAPGPSITPTLLNPNQYGTPSPQPYLSGSPQPQPQFQPQSQYPPRSQFMGSSPQPPFQQYGGGMQQQPQSWAAGANMAYYPQQQQQQGQWGAM
ncbi:ARF GAP-like zinc finger-containing protein [Favolaschia claudopus]|uniref:ARF GAP-like zinc finger-containing protein n=1 Tax=Favolaschia claudopus TaxID=2862362 RepID=A0AAW0CRA0_9AGAR